MHAHLFPDALAPYTDDETDADPSQGDANLLHTPPEAPVRPTDAPPPTVDRGDRACANQSQTGLNLFLDLKTPAQMPDLLKMIEKALPEVRAALHGLHNVHFARFLPLRDGSSLVVVTEYDGDLKSYIMDFVAVLGDVFTAILQFVKDAPRLPVKTYPNDFWEFVQRNNLAKVQPWSAFPLLTVLEIQGGRQPLPPPIEKPPASTFALNDIQGNILNGYRAKVARHFALVVNDPVWARRFLASLVAPPEPGDTLRITTAARWSTRPEYFLNIGFTAQGLKALGLADATLALFPEAFRRGPAAEVIANAVGDTGPSQPSNWRLGNPAARSHLLLSLLADEPTHLEARTTQLRRLFADSGLRELSCEDAASMNGKEHFGYRDGLAQPRIAGVIGREVEDMQPPSPAGAFLLGRDYVNQYGGNFLGDLPQALGDNGTYAAVRIMEQHVDEFEAFLTEAAAFSELTKEMVAAKLMGRWRNGVPLTLRPDAYPTDVKENELNAFDYAPTAAHPMNFDDFDGLRCPLSSHARRLNPRGSLAVGKPHNRRIVRRSLPYERDGERGLFGVFICGDLEMQYEFLLTTWINGGISTPGVHGMVDPFLGTPPPTKEGGDRGRKFVIRTSDEHDPIVLRVPRLVTTRGSEYIFVPGIGGLHYLAALS